MKDRAAEALGALWETPPRAFTKRRTALARELTDAGQAEAAAEVKRARKPSGSVWGVAALARQDASALRAVLDAGEAVRREQRKALSGAGAGGLRDATREFQKAVGAATAAVEQILKEAGESASAAVMARVRDTLLASAEADADARKALEKGTLEEDLSAVGFGNVSALRLVKGGARPAQAPARQPAKERAAAERRERAEQARREREEREERERQRRLTKKELERREKAAREAEAEAERLERLAAQMEARARAAREKADGAARVAEEARGARDETRAALRGLQR